MSKVRYLLDENVNRAIKRQLKRLDGSIEVIAIGEPEAPPSGVSDPEILAWIERHGYILVTENRRTMPAHLKEHLEKGDMSRAFSSFALLRRFQQSLRTSILPGSLPMPKSF